MNSRRSWSATATELIRRGLGASTAASDEGRTTIALDAGTGLPVVMTARVITPEDVRTAEDDSTPA